MTTTTATTTTTTTAFTHTVSSGRMRSGRLLSQTLGRQMATGHVSGQSTSTASKAMSSLAASSVSLHVSSPSSSTSSWCTQSYRASVLLTTRQRACLTTSASSARPDKTRTARAEVQSAFTSHTSSLGQVPSMDLESQAFAAMSLRDEHVATRAANESRSTEQGRGTAKDGAKRAIDATGTGAPRTKRVVTRKERRTKEKAARKKQKLEARANSRFGKAGLQRKMLSPFVREDGQFRTFKPLTPSLRWVRQTVQPHLHSGQPVWELTLPKRNKAGRNHHGKITVRGRGGGNRTRLRIVDFMRTVPGLQTVVRIERDPNRSAHIALIQHNETKAVSYIIAPEGVRAGDTVESYRQGADSFEGSSLDLGIFRTKAIRPGNVLPLRLIPIGTTVHALTLRAEGGAKLVRSAGSYGQIVSFVNRSKTSKPKAVGPEGEEVAGAGSTLSSSVLPGTASNASNEVEASTSSNGMPNTTHVQVRLQSGEVRLLPIGCSATIGRVSNADHEHERLGKAGRTRWMGRKPKVRGMAMNAVDHPHGGGRGKSKSNKHTRSIYGWKTKGPRTRKPGTRNGNRMVVRERPRMNGKRASKS